MVQPSGMIAGLILLAALALVSCVSRGPDESSRSLPSQANVDPEENVTAVPDAGEPHDQTHALASNAGSAHDLPQPTSIETAEIGATCRRIGGKLGSVSVDDCLSLSLRATGAKTVEDSPILVKEYPPLEGREPVGRALMLGGIHGDEFAAVSIMFKWMGILDDFHSGLLHWRIVPVLNPDGLLKEPGQRMNANGVDLNRNFPVPAWSENPLDFWQTSTARNPRRYPGKAPLSEPESQWLAREIRSFEPDVIISVHAPLEIVDYDGPPNPPQKLGPLLLHQMGTYPGSLGRWAGQELGIPVITIELPRAGIMPTPAEQREIWLDLVEHLRTNVRSRAATATAALGDGP